MTGATPEHERLNDAPGDPLETIPQAWKPRAGFWRAMECGWSVL
jgi:hypothetical protein